MNLKGLKEISHGCNCKSGARVISIVTQISSGAVSPCNIYRQRGWILNISKSRKQIQVQWGGWAKGRRGELLHNTKRHDAAQPTVTGCKCLRTDVICSSLSDPAHFDPELTHWDCSPLGSFLMRKLINRLNKVCFHEGIWGQIYLHHGECITATDSHC